MKTFTQSVECCDDCPNIVHAAYGDFVCMQTQSILKSRMSIPNDCPLPDAPAHPRPRDATLERFRAAAMRSLDAIKHCRYKMNDNEV
jgi:hypothetical protein